MAVEDLKTTRLTADMTGGLPKYKIKELLDAHEKAVERIKTLENGLRRIRAEAEQAKFMSTFGYIADLAAEYLGQRGERMNADEYQKAAANTECDNCEARLRMKGRAAGPDLDWLDTAGGDNLLPIRLNHAALGIVKEGSELADLVLKWVYYGLPVTPQMLKDRVKDELGDVLWFAALACNALGLTMEEVMVANAEKLARRHPGKFSAEAVAAKDAVNDPREAKSGFADALLMCRDELKERGLIE